MKTPAKSLLAVDYGPATGGRMQIWHWLSSFENWPELVTGLQSVVQLDEGSAGRGSTLQLQWAHKSERWEISHWNPGQQLDLLRRGASGRRAYRIAIEESGDPGYYQLVVYCQAEYEGFLSFLGPLITAIESNRARVWLQQLLGGLSRLQAQA